MYKTTQQIDVEIQMLQDSIKALEKQREDVINNTPTVCGIGYLGENYNKKTDKQLRQRWSSLLRRCYSINSTSYKTYGSLGVTVAEEWYNFSNFKEWFLNNVYDIETDEKLVVDKDILVSNNKIYSADTCLLVPISFNSLFAGLNEYSGKSQRRATGIAGINKMDNGTYRLDIFGTTFSNFKSLEIAKETRINVYKALLNGLIQNYPTMPKKVRDAILNYKF